MGELFAPFTAVAAENPFALYGTRRSPQALSSVSAENRFIGFPYPKWMNAMDGVDQGAAVVMTSVGQAKRLGIDPARWVFLHGCAEASEKLLVTERVNYYSSPAMAINSAQALAMAGKEMADIDLIDIYSCFPSAVEIACAALGIQTNDSRGLTLTGGLPFFGGPGNNYSMHAIATLVPLLRSRRTASSASARATFGMITANGGYLSKHATGIYSATPVEGEWRCEDPASYQDQIDAMLSPRFTETPEGDARVETYTVIHERGVPVRGIIIGRTVADNTRFIANTNNDSETLARMMAEEMLERPGRVITGAGAQGTNLFSF
jgi:acetyl-CoA C-acetyltransferase